MNSCKVFVGTPSPTTSTKRDLASVATPAKSFNVLYGSRENMLGPVTNADDASNIV